MKVAVVGATGMVGQVMLKVLEERDFPVDELIPVGSDKSIGKEIYFRGKAYKCVSMSDAVSMKPEIAIFSAGGTPSLEWAPKLQEQLLSIIPPHGEWMQQKNWLYRRSMRMC